MSVLCAVTLTETYSVQHDSLTTLAQIETTHKRLTCKQVCSAFAIAIYTRGMPTRNNNPQYCVDRFSSGQASCNGGMNKSLLEQSRLSRLQISASIITVNDWGQQTGHMDCQLCPKLRPSRSDHDCLLDSPVSNLAWQSQHQTQTFFGPHRSLVLPACICQKESVLLQAF